MSIKTKKCCYCKKDKPIEDFIKKEKELATCITCRNFTKEKRKSNIEKERIYQKQYREKKNKNKNKVTYHCSKCGESGHNANTCGLILKSDNKSEIKSDIKNNVKNDIKKDNKCDTIYCHICDKTMKRKNIYKHVKTITHLNNLEKKRIDNPDIEDIKLRKYTKSQK